MTTNSGNTERIKTNGHSTTQIIVRAEPAPQPREIVCWPEPVIMVEHVELPHPPDKRLVLVGDPASPSARSYRLLRHRLLTSGNPRVIGVTSAVPGEGKTTCAINLALSIAEDALGNVLLLEANARRPALTHIFGLPELDGIRSAEAREPCYTVTAVGGTRLHVASATADTAAHGRLDRPRFGEILCDLRAAYDHVIVDAASVLESADADVVSELCDGVIVTTRRELSHRRATRRAIDELQPANILGLVLIDS